MATFGQFWARVDVSNVTTAQAAKLQSALLQLYNTQIPAILELFDAVANNQSAGSALAFGISSQGEWANQEYGDANLITVQFDALGELDSRSWMFNSLGQWVKQPGYATLAHEMAHILRPKNDDPYGGGQTYVTSSDWLAASNQSLTGAPDPVTGIAPQQGGAVRIQNLAAAALASDPAGATRISYNLSGSAAEFNQGVSYSFGQNVDNGFKFDEVSGVAIYDRRNWTSFVNDLVFGSDSRAETFYMGSGNDFAYGKGKSDIFYTSGPVVGNHYMDGGVRGELANSTDIDELRLPTKLTTNGSIVSVVKPSGDPLLDQYYSEAISRKTALVSVTQGIGNA